MVKHGARGLLNRYSERQMNVGETVEVEPNRQLHFNGTFVRVVIANKLGRMGRYSKEAFIFN